jgi:hypothetical protein
MAIRFLLFSELTVCVWALILGVVIVLVRRSGVASGVEREPVDPIAP